MTENAEDRCAEDGCGHPRYVHNGRLGACTDGRDAETVRCDCRGFVDLDPAQAERRTALLDMLTALGITRTQAMQEAAEATVAMRPLIREAIALGVMPTRLERVTGVSRRALYDWLAEDRSPE